MNETEINEDIWNEISNPTAEELIEELKNGT